MALKSKKPMLQWYSKIFYGAGALIFGMMQQTVGGLIMFFGIVAHGISGFLMGIICAIAMLVAAVVDPIAGNVSDRTTGKLLGKRLGYVITGVFALALINVFVWNLPLYTKEWVKVIWLLVGVIGMEAVGGFIQPPYTKLGSELAGSKLERAAVNRYRYSFLVTGIVIPVALMGIFLTDGVSTLEYRAMASVASMLIIIFGMSVFFGTYSHIPRLNAKALSETPERRTIKSVFNIFISLLKDKYARKLLLGYAMAFVSISFMTTVGFFYFRYTAGFDFKLIAALLGIIFLFVVISDPVWRNFSSRFTKRSLLIAAIVVMLIGIILFGLVFVFGYYSDTVSLESFGYYIPPVVLIGMGGGGVFTLPRQMVSDRDDNTRTVGGYMTFCYKLAAGLTALINGVLLDIIGFSASGVVPAYTHLALGWILVAGLLLSTLASLVFYCKNEGKES